MEIEAARLLIYKAASEKDRKMNFSSSASMAERYGF